MPRNFATLEPLGLQLSFTESFLFIFHIEIFYTDYQHRTGVRPNTSSMSLLSLIFEVNSRTPVAEFLFFGFSFSLFLMF